MFSLDTELGLIGLNLSNVLNKANVSFVKRGRIINLVSEKVKYIFNTYKYCESMESLGEMHTACIQQSLLGLVRADQSGHSWHSGRWDFEKQALKL